MAPKKITPSHWAWTRTMDPFGIGQSFLEVGEGWAAHPAEYANSCMNFNQQLWSIINQTQEHYHGLITQDTIPASEYDKRFQDPIWFNNPAIDFIKEYYLLVTRTLENNAFDAPEVDAHYRNRAGFWLRQYLNAMAPTNFFWSNPRAITQAYETGGKSIIRGFELFLEDLRKQTISMVDADAFTVGRNLATTPGHVVFRNALIEVIQYTPATPSVQAIPILIVPPWINKFYILDLEPNKSLVRHLVHQGFTVFMISWKNPNQEMRDTTLSDYMLNGILPAVKVAQDISGSEQVHAVGYCIGGTALSATMAYLHQDKKFKKNPPISSWTLLCSLQDFSDPGCVDVFIDEEAVDYIQDFMKGTGFLDGKDLGNVFRMLRSNSLIWEYYVSQYLLGEKAAAFDILFWNTDNTRLPQKMHEEYLRAFYLENALIEGKWTVNGQKIDLSAIAEPLYAVGTEQDHITPWKETFKIHQFTRSPVRYALATSGHILGVLSPPVDPPKRRYWVSDLTDRSQSADEWMEKTPKISGSWWDDWFKWLKQHTGKAVNPPNMGNDTFPAKEPAPGLYVLEK